MYDKSKANVSLREPKKVSQGQTAPGYFLFRYRSCLYLRAILNSTGCAALHNRLKPLEAQELSIGAEL